MELPRGRWRPLLRPPELQVLRGGCIQWPLLVAAAAKASDFEKVMEGGGRAKAAACAGRCMCRQKWSPQLS